MLVVSVVSDGVYLSILLHDGKSRYSAFLLATASTTDETVHSFVIPKAHVKIEYQCSLTLPPLSFVNTFYIWFRWVRR